MNTRYKLTREMPNDIDVVHCQPASRYLLKGMEQLGSNGTSFTRKDLIQWMEDNLDDPQYNSYTSNIRSKKNLKNYWNLARMYRSNNNNTPHNARILNFDTFYREV